MLHSNHAIGTSVSNGETIWVSFIFFFTVLAHDNSRLAITMVHSLYLWALKPLTGTLYAVQVAPICWRAYATLNISCAFTVDGNCNRLLREPVDQCNTGGVNGKQVCLYAESYIIVIFIRWSFHREGSKLIFAASGAQTLDPTAAISNVRSLWSPPFHSFCVAVIAHV